MSAAKRLGRWPRGPLRDGPGSVAERNRARQQAALTFAGAHHLELLVLYDQFNKYETKITFPTETLINSIQSAFACFRKGCSRGPGFRWLVKRVSLICRLRL